LVNLQELVRRRALARNGVAKSGVQLTGGEGWASMTLPKTGVGDESVSKARVLLLPLRYRSTAEEKRYQLHLLMVDGVVVVVGDCCAPSKRGQK